MSYFVIVTYDLTKARTSVYPKVNAKLKKVDFSKLIVGRKRIRNELPSNTFVAEFDNEKFHRSSAVCGHVRVEIERIFRECNVAGHYFVASGRKWAWKIGVVSRRAPHRLFPVSRSHR